MNGRANRRYKPKFYPGTVTFFTTVDTRYPKEDRRLMMCRYAQESRVISLSGNRSRLFMKPVVEELARQLQACLKQADDAQSHPLTQDEGRKSEPGHLQG